MSVDHKTIQKIAHLARIRVSAEEREELASELSNIFDWIEELDKVDTNDVDPMTSVVQASATLRKDNPNDGGYPKKITANAPEAVEHFFTVPKVVE
mgnify:FL=1|tara:strand:+ start:340 stop:627 length:288 start_codon:yes stop_codon:yes gene_type:complete